MGNRLVDLTALSNAQPTDAELGRFKVPLEPEAVRKKMRSLQRAMQEDADLFAEEELRERAEQEERMRARREEEAAAAAAAEEERERKEREREEIRRRAQAGKADTEQWWLKYTTKDGGKEREIAKLKARLTRFNKIAKTTEAEGERENALRLARQAQEKLESLTAEAEDADAE
jgi:hypothetical protein